MDYIVDTNVPMLNPQFHLNFPKTSTFYITIPVLKELDNAKEFSYNARQFANLLLSNKCPNSLKVVHFCSSEKLEGDDALLEICQDRESMVLLTNDNYLILRAKALGVLVKKFEHAPVIYDGIGNDGVNDMSVFDGEITDYYGRVLPKVMDKKVWGLEPKNIEQRIALEHLMNPDINLVTISGFAGSGKTLLAIVSALQLVLNDQIYSKIVISRPVIPLGEQDIGFLPGSLEDKMLPWIQPIIDNINAVTPEEYAGNKSRRKTKVLDVNMLMEGGQLEIAALAFIRGRSINNSFIIIDEAQNLSAMELKTILTRAGQFSKIVLTGDLEQIDIKRSGYQQVINAFKDSKIAAHVTLKESVRSQLAEEAASRL
jgi:predicted ribonuclease YlaK